MSQDMVGHILKRLVLNITLLTILFNLWILYKTFIHTNNMERSWRSLRASVSHVKRSLPQKMINSFIDIFQFQNFFSQDVLYNIFLQIVLSIEQNNLNINEEE